MFLKTHLHHPKNMSIDQEEEEEEYSTNNPFELFFILVQVSFVRLALVRPMRRRVRVRPNRENDRYL